MFVRVLFLLLLALNIGSGLWLLLGGSSETGPVAAHDAGVPVLVLLAEQDRGIDPSAELALEPVSQERVADEVCVTLGPFTNQADMRSAAGALAPLATRLRHRETHVAEARGHWVYLPAFETREEALAAARELAARGVRDYYVVTAGDQQNTVSLGLFRDEGNAQRRRTQISELGFAAQLTVRSEDRPQYWVDVASRPADNDALLASLALVDVPRQPADCDWIAD